MAKMLLSTRLKITLSIILLMIMISSVLLAYDYINAYNLILENTRLRLQNVAVLAVQRIDPSDHSLIKGPEDMRRPEYGQLQEILREVRGGSLGIHHVYTMRLDEVGNIVFAVDADNNPATFVPPGNIYADASKLLKNNIANLQLATAENEFYTDRWGTWLSGYAPIRDSSGRLEGVLGIDMASSRLYEFQQQALKFNLTFFIICIIVSVIVGTLAGRRLTLSLEKEKAISRELTREVEKFRLAVANASDHIIITDNDGFIIFANQGVANITGFKGAEVLGKKAGSLALWGGLMDKGFYEKMWHTIKIDKKTFSGQIENKRKNGERYFAWSSISPIIGASGEVEFFVGVERDITKEVKIDRAKSEFVSLASHQLRTPLSAINWYSEMLLAGDAGKLSKAQKEYISEVYASNKRMIDLVNALLNISRIDLGTVAVDPEPTDFCAIARSVLSEMKPQLEAKKMTVAAKYDKKLPLINADPKLIRIILQNLLTNAVKYTPERGRVAVEISQKGKNVLLKVSDNGYGIPAAAKDKIFTKMYRADNIRQHSTDGTGLGLYMSRAIIEEAKGRIWFDSVEKKGSSFYVTLPLTGMKKKEGTKELTSIK